MHHRQHEPERLRGARRRRAVRLLRAQGVSEHRIAVAIARRFGTLDLVAVDRATVRVA